MNVVATIQARMRSSRLPGKVLKPIVGKPILQHQIERILQCKRIDKVVIATSTSETDDVIEEFGKSLDIPVYRGSENDVLDRVSQALIAHQADVHVELLGDSPLTDPLLLDDILRYYLEHSNQFDMVCNDMKTTYPPGMEIKVYNAKKLIQANNTVPENDPLREHVSVHLKKSTSPLSIKNLAAPSELHYPNLYLEVDTTEDFKLMEAIFGALYDKFRFFGLAMILDYLKTNPTLAEKNRFVHRRWKEIKTV